MRAGISGLQAPFPLGESLPGIYQDDGFVQDLCAGLDEVLVPLVATLDCLPRLYRSGDHAARRPGVAARAGRRGPGRRGARASSRGRPAGRRAAPVAGDVARTAGHGAAYCGVEPELVESGGSGWSAEGGAPLPGDREPSMLVRVRVPDPAAVDVDRLDALVAATKPAHIPHRVEVVSGG